MKEILGRYDYQEQAEKLGLNTDEEPSLTDNYKVALNYYTDNGYLLINSELRSEKPTQQIRKISDYIDGALKWLPDHKNELCVIRYSDLNQNILNQIKQPDAVIHELGFTSTSSNIDFIFPTERKYKIIIYKNHGSEITAFSQYKEEDEVLIDRSSFFKVLRLDQEINTIYLEQISVETLESIEGQ
jgi:hypothetical protein